MIIGFVISVFTILLSGYIVVDILSKDFINGALEKLCLSFAIGCWVIGIIIHLLYCFNLPMNLISVLLPQAALLSLFLIIKKKDKASLWPQINFKINLNLVQSILLFIICFEVFYCFVDALRLPFVLWDAWGQHGYKAKILFLDKVFPSSIWIYPVNLPNIGYPLLISYLGSYIYLFIGKIYEPFFKLFDALFLPCLLIATYGFLKKQLNKTASFLFLVFLTTVPFLNMHVASGYLDFIIAFYFAISFIYLFNYLKEGNEGYLLFSAILIGISMWIKNEGLAFWISVILSLSCLAIFKKAVLKFKHFFIITILPFLIYLPWCIIRTVLKMKVKYLINLDTKQILYGIPYRFACLAKVFIGEITNLQKWNIVWVLFFISVSLLLLRKFRTKESILLALIILFQFVFYCGICIIWPAGKEEILMRYSTSVDRLLLHFVPLVFMFIALQVNKVGEEVNL